MEEGIVPGGGLALIRAGEALEGVSLNGDEQTGVNILKAALVKPLMLISQNTGVSGEVILDGTLKGEGDYGYDAETGQYGNLLEIGIMDPAKVTRAAIENASSVAAMVLTTESLISDIPQPEAAAPAMPPMDY